MALKGKTFEEIRDQCLQGNKLFEDPDFPAEDKSIFYNRAPARATVWKRPREICSDPQFFVGGALRFDVKQGMIGNCWFLAAVSSLTLEPKLLARVVPQDQDFKDKYAGIFRFRFWQYGNWVDVVVDDRLPTYNDKLVFVRSADDNEFWSALLQKAYAKLVGSYEGMKGGQTSEAMTDLTGGITEAFDTTKEDSNVFFQNMLKAIRRGSLMCCSIDAKPNEIEAKGPSGLVKGKAYSITGVRMVNIRTHQGESVMSMIRIRNPWGNEREWTGAWSDQSREWQFVSDDERRELDLTFEDDGEFWMSFDDFSTHFNRVEICYLGPDAFESDASPAKFQWETNTFEGKWQLGTSAGGCRKFIKTFASNPQYRVEVIDPDEDDADDRGTLIVALMQKERREGKAEGAKNLTIGYAIYKVEGEDNGLLDKDFFMYHQTAARSPEFTNSREVICRYILAPGNYCIVPSTNDPNQEGEFILRIFSEKAIGASELDDETEMYDPESDEEVTKSDEELDARILAIFRRVAGTDEEVGAFELQEILNTSNMKEFHSGGISVEACRTIIMKTTSKFKKYDTDNSNHMDGYELRQALRSCGFSLSNKKHSSLMMWYTNKDGQIFYDDFLHCIFRLKRLFGLFNDAKTGSRAEFSLDEFIQSMIYL